MLIHELRPQETSGFSTMTFPAFRRVLGKDVCPLYPGESDEHWIRPLALGAEAGGRPVGLLLGGLPAGDGEVAEVLSVFVQPGERRQGIAARLLGHFEGLLRERGIARVEALYTTGKTGAATFGRLIDRAGWEAPSVRMLIYKCGLDQAVRMPWFGSFPVRDGLEIFPWRDLLPEEAEALRRSHAEKPWIDDDLLPWRFDQHGFEEVSSVGVKLDGEVVGWVINHAVGGPDLVRFTCSFIRRDLARHGRLVAAYSESIRRLTSTPCTRCMFAVPISKKEMARFVERRCAPFGGQLTESRGAGKTFGRSQEREEDES